MTGAPVSTSRGAAKGFEETGTCTILAAESIEGPQNFTDEHPHPLSRNEGIFRGAIGDSTNKSTISGVLSNLAITNKTAVGFQLVEMPHYLPKGEGMGSHMEMPWERWAKFVHIDEAGFNLHLTSGAGWARVGSTPEIEAPRDRQRNASSPAALTPGRKMESCVIGMDPQWVR